MDFNYDIGEPTAAVMAYQQFEQSQAALPLANQSFKQATKDMLEVTKSMAGRGGIGAAFSLIPMGFAQLTGYHIEQTRLYKIMRAGLMTAVLGYGAMQILNVINNRQTIVEGIKATIETAAAVVAQNYAGIALAASTAAFIAVSFGGAYYVGKSVSMQRNASYATPEGRREILATVGGA